MAALDNDAKKAQAVIAQAKALSTSSLDGSIVSDNEVLPNDISSNR